MIRNYLKITFRHLWRNRLFTLLNIMGLAVGISACWVIYQIVDYEFSYDAKLPHSENIYKVISAFNRQGKESRMGGVSAPLYQGIESEITGITNTVPVFDRWVSRAEVKRAQGMPFVQEDLEGVVATNISYFNMLPYTWLAGDRRTALDAPESVVLTESRAKVYFPAMAPEDMLHQTITYFGQDTVIRTVTGIVADYSTPSEFTSKEFFPLPHIAYEANAWTNTMGGDKLYIQFEDGANTATKLDEINELDARHWSHFQEQLKSEGSELALTRTRSYELLPIRDAHFATHVSDFGVTKTNKSVLYGLIGIGVFLLILACINYINMSVAQIPQRGKEIGVRKTLGGGRWYLIGQFLSETLLTVSVASIVALGLGRLAFWLLADIIPAGVQPDHNMHLLAIFMIGLIILVTIMAGIYPGWLITRVKTTHVFRNFLSGSVSKHPFNIQKTLIVFQFAIALVFIIGTVIVGMQLRYTLKADMGFDKNAIVLVDVPWKYLGDPLYQDKQFVLQHELNSLPEIESVSLGNAPLTGAYSSSPFAYTPKAGEPMEITAYKKTIDTAYLKLYHMELIAGRNIYASDTISEFIINETAAQALGFSNPEEAIGQFIGQRGATKHPIVGVVKDFHTQDFYTPITPTVLFSHKPGLSSFNIRLDGHHPEQWQATLNTIGEKWTEFYPAQTYHYRFYDETLEAMYRQERQIGKLIHLATGITIFISCLGLFGLATFTAFQRTKEIGIRKVLGASVSGIVSLLSKDFIKLVFIAIIIASPIAWWAMNNWLDDFAYRIEIQWWMFAVAGLGAILIALITVSSQAIRAAVANPVDSLRDE